MPDLKESILTNTTARRMVNHVSPIYANSYVGLWIFEAISREYEDAWQLINTLPDQLFPETATWAIGLWEQRYGIEPDESLLIEERRRRVILKRSVPRPMNPQTLIAMLLNFTNRITEYQEHTGPYTFGVYLNNTPGGLQVDFDAIQALIRKHKQAHKSFDFAFQSEATAAVTMETGYFRIVYALAGQANAGQKPAYTNTTVKAEKTIIVNPGEAGIIYHSIPCGTIKAGAAAL